MSDPLARDQMIPATQHELLITIYLKIIHRQKHIHNKVT